jgi:hypothetical protein
LLLRAKLSLSSSVSTDAPSVTIINWLLESTVLHPAGYRGIRALALPTIDLVVRVIALVEHHTAVILVS